MNNKERPPLLFVYYTRDEWPIRALLTSHFSAFENYYDGPVVRLNTAFPYDVELLKSIPFAYILYHSSALALRWHHSTILPLTTLAQQLSKTPAKKIAAPQDDYAHSEQLVSFFNHARIDRILTPVSKHAAKIAYRGLHPSVEINRCLTHYLSDADIGLAETFTKAASARDYDVSYRAWKARPWVGRFGQLKVNVGKAAIRACADLGLSHNISVEKEDTIFGKAWWRFLGNTRAVVGVEGGSSIHDPQGTIMRQVESYLAEHPEAEYEDVESKLLFDTDQNVEFSALSPRHLEAAATKTAQILVEGEYSGVLIPYTHYIPVRRDFSDMKQACGMLKENKRIDEMIDRAYSDLILSDRFSWKVFVKAALEGLTTSNPALTDKHMQAMKKLNRRDKLNYRLLQAEVKWGESPPALKKALGKTFRFMRPLLARP